MRSVKASFSFHKITPKNTQIVHYFHEDLLCSWEILGCGAPGNILGQDIKGNISVSNRGTPTLEDGSELPWYLPPFNGILQSSLVPSY